MHESAPGVDTAALAAIVRARLFEDAEPPRIGRFTVLARLGSGGMGVVYSAFDPELDRKVALKLLFAGASDRGRLAREAQVMARLNHPNVAQVYEVGRHGDATYIAIEHVSGRTLRAWARTGTSSARARLAVLVQAGRGLAAAHTAGVIHRDFKPENVIVGDDGRVRVLDFGLARVDGETTSSGAFEPASSPAQLSPNAMTPRSTDSGAGTPAYMAPEQWRGEEVDARTDVYAFCVTAWEILEGRHPFVGSSSAARGAPPKSTTLPRPLERILRRGLAPERVERPASMDAVLLELERDPNAARRRAFVAVGGALLLGTGLAWRWADELVHTRACADEAAAIEAEWNPARADRLAAAFAEIDATSTFERARTHFDTFAAAWSSARDEACLASPPRDDSEACLDDARSQLAALLERLESPTRALVPFSISAAISLPDPAWCADPRTTRMRELATLDPSDRRRLLEIEVLRETSAFEEALDAAHQLELDLEGRGAPGIAAARLAVGHALRELGRHADARAAFESAYYAGGAAGDDFTAMRAAIALVDTVGFRLAQRERGEEWGRAARMYIQQLELEGDPAEATLESRLGALLRTTDVEASLAAHRRALAIRVNNFGELHPAVGSSYFDIGAGLGERGETDAAIAALLRAVEIDEQTLGPDHPALANALNSLGQQQDNRGDYEVALATLQRALAITERTLGPDHEAYASTLIAIGNVDLHFGREHEAEDRYRRALEIVERTFSPTHPRVVAALAALAGVQARTGDGDGALESYRRALAIEETGRGPDDAALVPILGNMGILLVNRGAIEEGLVYLHRAERIIAERFGENNDNRAVVLSAIASTESSRGHPENAIPPLEEALAIMQRTGAAADRKADIEYELGRALHLSGGDRDRALALAKSAKAAWLPIGPPRAEWVGYAEELIAELQDAARKRGAG